ncbi:hypothetical protein H072_6695 [Dactylellina haptotyla CBS 200.50]|uniref:C2H2-type domain-containing protein n=1 Tax=Dactylellina haptotyla (strain CBS 200.50) TaxID=1284197 RepID=S8AEJ0_DACHA|nr:hypothetical protein H072_6695 [Dactylellina haptotyla CBS 200.50]
MSTRKLDENNEGSPKYVENGGADDFRDSGIDEESTRGDPFELIEDDEDGDYYFVQPPKADTSQFGDNLKQLDQTPGEKAERDNGEKSVGISTNRLDSFDNLKLPTKESFLNEESSRGCPDDRIPYLSFSTIKGSSLLDSVDETYFERRLVTDTPATSFSGPEEHIIAEPTSIVPTVINSQIEEFAPLDVPVEKDLENIPIDFEASRSNRRKVATVFKAASAAYRKLKKNSRRSSPGLREFVSSLKDVQHILGVGYASLTKVVTKPDSGTPLSNLEEIYCYLHTAYAFYQADRPGEDDKILGASFRGELKKFRECLPPTEKQGASTPPGQRDMFDEIVKIMWEEIDDALKWIHVHRPHSPFAQITRSDNAPKDLPAVLRKALGDDSPRNIPPDPGTCQQNFVDFSRFETVHALAVSKRTTDAGTMHFVSRLSSQQKHEDKKWSAAPSKLLWSQITQDFLRFLMDLSSSEMLILFLGPLIPCLLAWTNTEPKDADVENGCDRCGSPFVNDGCFTCESGREQANQNDLNSFEAFYALIHSCQKYLRPVATSLYSIRLESKLPRRSRESEPEETGAPSKSASLSFSTLVYKKRKAAETEVSTVPSVSTSASSSPQSSQDGTRNYPANRKRPQTDYLGAHHTCGIDGCSKQYTNRENLKKHKNEKHASNQLFKVRCLAPNCKSTMCAGTNSRARGNMKTHQSKKHAAWVKGKPEVQRYRIQIVPKPIPSTA